MVARGVNVSSIQPATDTRVASRPSRLILAHTAKSANVATRYDIRRLAKLTYQMRLIWDSGRFRRQNGRGARGVRQSGGVKIVVGSGMPTTHVAVAVTVPVSAGVSVTSASGRGVNVTVGVLVGDIVGDMVAVDVSVGVAVAVAV